jgi:hypothetical protein
MRLYPTWWRKNFLSVEFGIALFVTAILLLWWKYGNGIAVLKEIVHGNRGQIYGTLASIFGSLLGFVITALSVVLGFSSSDRLKVLRSSSYYKQLWDVFTSAIRVLGVTTILWLAALFFDRDGAPKPLILVFCLSISFLAILRMGRCVWVLERIVEVLTLKSESKQS